MNKRLLTVAAIMMAACATSGEPEKTANVWEPGETLPTYRAKQMPSGEVHIYEYGNPYEYKYRVTPAGKVYKRSDPFQRVSEIKPADKKGE
jgi:hypothetical protein